MYEAAMDDARKEHKPKTKQPLSREERLKAELRANLARRKQQSRARRQGAEDDRPGDLAAGEEDAS